MLGYLTWTSREILGGTQDMRDYVAHLVLEHQEEMEEITGVRLDERVVQISVECVK